MAQGLFGRAARRLGIGQGAQHHRTLGDAARDRGDWPAAAVHYRDFLRDQPGDFAIWVQLGHAAKEAGDYVAAEHAYLQAEAIRPEDADLALNLGHLLKQIGRRGDAQRSYARSFDLDGNLAARGELEALGVAPERNLSARRTSDDNPMVGNVDRIDGTQIRGWAVDPDPAHRPTALEAVLPDGRVIASGVASGYRPDVEAAGLGDAASGFALFVDAEDLAGETIEVDVRLARTGMSLDGSPTTITIPAPEAQLEARRVTSVRYVVAKPLAEVSGEHAIFVAYAPTGMLQPFVRRYLRLLADQDIAVSLIVNAERPVLLDDDLLAIVASATVRENRGYDFGAWAHQLRLEPRLYAASALYIINDSVFGPSDEGRFAEMIAAVRTNPADLVGLTQTLERGWHIQSYFLRIGGALLASYAFQQFVNGVHIIADKDEIINTFEVPLTRKVCIAGFTADAVFPIDEARNPTLFAWRALLAAGFPFVKLLLARGGFPDIDTKGIMKVLLRAGFDEGMLNATLDYRAAGLPPAEPDFPLLARPLRDDGAAEVVPAKPYKVAFYGPWNYDNGLGSASRGIISAIRQAGVRLNLHPVKKTFHVHRPLVPPHDVVDFDGAADVAIVHLNPDSWHLLTDEQRAEIGRAKRRIGYWVWEMEHLPEAWRRDFGSVDRIWAPSGYNAALYEAQDEAPVDVIPHVVPVDPEPAAGGGALRAALGLPEDRRLILYVFDGASYLVRKNPAALVRAFAASGLADRGWSLVLKTKHLMDRAEEGAALAALAQGTPGVILLDRSLTAGELAGLVAACDIYASPHCSEGFGLTVAEAMAAGRSVVATDYSGTTQFLDASCGYPVRAPSWTLEEDYGHYTEGGTWAKIDETALAEALTTAAGRIDTGDNGMGDAARARIAQALSIDTVGAAVAASLDAVLADTKRVRRAPPRIDGRARGVALAAFQPGDMLTVIPLKAGTLAPTIDPVGTVADSRDVWALFVPEDAGLHPLAPRLIERQIAARPDAAILYADDVAYGEATLHDQVRLKPEFDQTLFAAQDYIGAPLLVRGSALHELGFETANGEAALYDLVLRAAERGMSIGRIPEVLVVQSGRRPIAPAKARQALLARSPLYAGYTPVPGAAREGLQLERRFEGERPHVTLCVPTRRTAVPDGEGTFIERFLASVARADWPRDRLTVIVGDDVLGNPDWAHDDWPFTLRRIETLRAPGEAFNFSAKMNQLWRAADSEIVIMANDDVVARDSAWLPALVGFAMDRSVGAVGARLLFDDLTIQHAGVVGGIFGTSVHPWIGRRGGAKTYGDWAITQREVSMTTAALLATRRGVLEAIGGFDEGFSLEFNDMDLCLKIRQLGLRIVYNPVAELIHSEKQSRGETVPPAEQLALFLSRWQGWLASDPALPPRMRRDMLDLTPAAGPGDWYA